MFEESGPSSRIEFYRASGPYGCLSNLYLAAVHFEGRTFPCSEYAYQFAKSNKPEIAEWLMAAPSPRLCASAAHGLLRYDVNPDWSRVKYERMRGVLLAKFGQHSPPGSRPCGYRRCRARRSIANRSYLGHRRQRQGQEPARRDAHGVARTDQRASSLRRVRRRICAFADGRRSAFRSRSLVRR